MENHVQQRQTRIENDNIPEFNDLPWRHGKVQTSPKKILSFDESHTTSLPSQSWPIKILQTDV